MEKKEKVDKQKVERERKQKLGITEYMEVYDSKFEGIDYFDGFDAKEVQHHYTDTNPLYEKHETFMPDRIGFQMQDRIKLPLDIK